MTTQVLVTNNAPKTGPFIEVSVYSKAAEGITPDNAKDHGIERTLVPIEGSWAVLMTNFRLAPGQYQEIWVHDLQFFVTREVS